MTKTKPDTAAPEVQADQPGGAPLSGPIDAGPESGADAGADAAAAMIDDAADASAEDVVTAPATDAAAQQAAAPPAAVVTAPAAKSKKLSADDLRATITTIEQLNNGLQRENLLAELRKIRGAKLEDKAGTYRIKLHGLEVTNTGGWALALTTWCSKARRACMSGEAE